MRKQKRNICPESMGFGKRSGENIGRPRDAFEKIERGCVVRDRSSRKSEVFYIALM
jgi:hypothetical protein